MKVTIKLQGFNEGLAEIRRARDRFPVVLKEELQKFGNEAVEHLKKTTWADGWGLPPKRHPNGKPPLIDSEKYINGYLAVVEGSSLGIYSQGMNDHMSNNDLAELLEYGNGMNLPPKPHLRPLFAWMEGRADVLGKRIFHGIFSKD
jgi:hypothetical protein